MPPDHADQAQRAAADQAQARRGAEHARQLALRAERLARLRPDGLAEPPAPPFAGQPPATDAEAALRDLLRGLLDAGAPPRPAAEAPPPLAKAAILHFQRPGAAEPAARPEPIATGGGLDRLPGAGPGLVWALRRAGLGSLAEVAALGAEDLASRLGPLGRLIPAQAWIAAARRAHDA